MDAKRRQELESQLSAYIDGELTDADRAEVEAFLAHDAGARRLLAELRATIAGLQALPCAKASGDLMADVRSRLERQALLGNAQPTGTMPSVTPSFGGRWIAAAAVIALTVVAGSVLWSFTDREAHPRRDQFARRTPAEAPSRAAGELENRKQPSRNDTHVADKLAAFTEDMGDYSVSEAAPPPAKDLVGLGAAGEKGRPIMGGGRLADTPTQSQNGLAPKSYWGQLAEQPAVEGRTVLADDYAPDDGKESDGGLTLSLGGTNAPTGGAQAVAREEVTTLWAEQKAASQPQNQHLSYYGYDLANRPVKIPEDHAMILDGFDSLQSPATQPASIPCRAASTRPLSTQPTASTKPASQTQPSGQITERISAPKPQAAPSRQ